MYFRLNFYHINPRTIYHTFSTQASILLNQILSSLHSIHIILMKAALYMYKLSKVHLSSTYIQPTHCTTTESKGACLWQEELRFYPQPLPKNKISFISFIVYWGNDHAFFMRPDELTLSLTLAIVLLFIFSKDNFLFKNTMCCLYGLKTYVGHCWFVCLSK